VFIFEPNDQFKVSSALEDILKQLIEWVSKSHFDFTVELQLIVACQDCSADELQDCLLSQEGFEADFHPDFENQEFSEGLLVYDLNYFFSLLIGDWRQFTTFFVHLAAVELFQHLRLFQVAR